MKGEAIKHKLSLLGKTQKELAELLGVTPQAIYEIMSSSDIKTGTLEKISLALDVPVSFFFEKSKLKVSTFSLRKELEKENVSFSNVSLSDRIGNKVRVLLKEQKKKLIGLCEYIGMTDAGLRKIFERDNCSVSVLLKIAEYFDVPINYFLPQSSVVLEDSSKDREIEFLKGQVKAYENALRALTSFSKERKLSKLSKLPELSELSVG